MIVIATALLGSLYGGYSARRRKGNRYDIAQYAVVYGLIGLLLGVFISIYLNRAM